MGKENQPISKNEKTLLICLNKFGEIIQFNKECQKITKYSRKDVIYKKILNFLIPTSYCKKWNEMFDLAIKNKKIDNFEIPFKSSDGKEILISLSNLTIGDEKSSDGRISFIGNIIDITNNIEKQLETSERNIDKKPEKIHNFVEYVEDKKKIDDIIFNDAKDEKTFDKTFYNGEGVIFSEDDKFKESPKFVKSFRNLTKKHKQSKNELLNFEKESDIKINKEDRIAQNQNIFFEEVADSDENIKKTQDNKFSNKDSDKIREYLKKTNIPEDIKLLIHSLDVRGEELNKFECRLIEDRKILDKRIVELSNWKEKLLVLELEIEKRRQDLVEQETAFLQNLASVSDNKNKLDVNLLSNKDEINSEDKPSQNTLYDIFDKILESAVIIQRGTIKKVNQSFAELLGYELNELVDKRLFDFFSPEGYPEIEKYYLDRLKGMKSSGYNIVLLKKDNIGMDVKVSTRPTFFNGEKAEIAIFNKTSSSEKNEMLHEIKNDENQKLEETENSISEMGDDTENETVEEQEEENPSENEKEDDNIDKIGEESEEDSNSSKSDINKSSTETETDNDHSKRTKVDES